MSTSLTTCQETPNWHILQKPEAHKAHGSLTGVSLKKGGHCFLRHQMTDDNCISESQATVGWQWPEKIWQRMYEEACHLEFRHRVRFQYSQTPKMTSVKFPRALPYGPREVTPWEFLSSHECPWNVRSVSGLLAMVHFPGLITWGQSVLKNIKWEFPEIDHS